MRGVQLQEQDPGCRCPEPDHHQLEELCLRLQEADGQKSWRPHPAAREEVLALQHGEQCERRDGNQGALQGPGALLHPRANHCYALHQAEGNC